MRHMLLKWVVNNIWYTWLWEFNFKVRVNVLNHKLMCSSFGMSRSWINFGNLVWWELRFSWVWELGCDWCLSLYIWKELLVISFGLSFRWRERECWHLSSSYTNLSCLLFSSKGYVTCTFGKYKDCLENYYVIKPLN